MKTHCVTKTPLTSGPKLAGQYGTKEGRDTICGPTVVVVKAVDVDCPDPSVVALISRPDGMVSDR